MTLLEVIINSLKNKAYAFNKTNLYTASTVNTIRKARVK